ncbi:MAG: YbaB/EbfC family nucleoid-associated protein [Acidobacteria bacterium]|nr:YbaB/EbfC family nucleoid-associated protein [Acidobacteriota bacterium]
MDVRAIMQQAQKMQEKLQQEIAALKVEASAGGSMVTVTMGGNRELLSVRIDPQILESKDAEMLEDLVRAAVNEANRKVEAALSDRMSGLRVPGF